MKKLIYNLLPPLWLVVMLIISIVAVSQTRGFYSWQYKQNDAQFYTGLSYQDLDKVTDNLLQYLTGQKKDLEMQFEVEGEKREIFDQREKLHMIDVQKLYRSVIYVALALLVSVLAGAGYLFKIDKQKAKFILYKKYKTTLIGSFGIIAVIGIVFWLNFNWFWTNFHKVFFSNDLWILDPAVSVMINMFPLDFFFSMCSVILLVFVLCCLGVFLLLMPKNKGKMSRQILE